MTRIKSRTVASIRIFSVLWLFGGLNLLFVRIGDSPKDFEHKITKKTKRLPRLLQPWFPSVHRIDSYSRNPRFDSTKRKCRTSTWGCCPAFSRCLAKTELCVTVVFFELCSAFALQSLYGMPSYFNSFVIPSEAEESLTTNS